MSQLLWLKRGCIKKRTLFATMAIECSLLHEVRIQNLPSHRELFEYFETEIVDKIKNRYRVKFQMNGGEKTRAGLKVNCEYKNMKREWANMTSEDDLYVFWGYGGFEYICFLSPVACPS